MMISLASKSYLKNCRFLHTVPACMTGSIEEIGFNDINGSRSAWIFLNKISKL